MTAVRRGAREHNLPAPLTPLVGREVEAAAIRERLLLSEVRLLTLTGPSGTGKTRLALHVADHLLDQQRAPFADGVWLVELATQPAAELVVPAIARTLGLQEGADEPLTSTLAAFLRDKQLLLVLDNFEHVVAAGPEVAALLETASGVKLLVTSRTPLGVYGEHIFPLQPLTLPDLARLPPPEALADNEAVALFLQRARAAYAGFQPTGLDLAAIAEVCVRLDGLPLAIELAAARVRVLPPAALLARISRRLELLTGGAHNRPVRQQTLRSAIDWSYQLLAEPEQRLFRWLGAVAGDVSLDAVEGVCRAASGNAAVYATGVLERLAALVDQSLLEQRSGPDSALPRFGMLETIHDFAAERLAASGDAVVVRAAHARLFLDLAENAEHEIADGREPQAALARLDAEHDNLRAALAWTLDEQREAEWREVGLRPAGALWRFWAMRGYLTEGQQWLDRALRAGDDVAPVWRARALNASGNLARWHGEFALATERHEACLALRRELGDRAGEATSLLNLGNIAFDLGDYPRAVDLFESSLELYRDVADQAGAAMALNNLGTALREAGQPEQAMALHEESLALRRALGDRLGIAQALDNLGRVALHRGDWQRAAPLLRESLVLSRELGDHLSPPRTIEDLASLAAAEGDPERAARLWGAADALRTRLSFPIAFRRRQRHTAELDDARSSLGQARFEAAWSEGQALDTDAAIAEALSEDLAAPQPPPPAKLPEGVEQLSAREREVAALIARGLTSREIAAELIVSERTVDTHADHIRTKLGLRSRTDIAAWAAAHGLRT